MILNYSFATSCDISDDGEQIHCSCREGYTGSRCQSCSAGYFGRPEVEGEFCKPCECSGNIDSSDTGACDSQTGECLQCKNNTFGTACNLCAPGFYGDAITLKDCQSNNMDANVFFLNDLSNIIIFIVFRLHLRWKGYRRMWQLHWTLQLSSECSWWKVRSL